MSKHKFKQGDKVVVVEAWDSDRMYGVKEGDIGTVLESSSVPYVKFEGIEMHAMTEGQIELAAPEIPASPFYVRAELGYSYKVDVDGPYFSLTGLETGRHWKNHAEASKIPGFFSEGRWTLIDPPAPAVVEPEVPPMPNESSIPDSFRIKVANGEEHTMVRVRKPYTSEAKHFRAYSGSTGRPYYGEDEVRRNIDSGRWTLIDTPPLPWMPPMPFFFKHKASGHSYRVDSAAGRPVLTSLHSGEKFTYYSYQSVCNYVRDGAWIIIDDPTPASDPVATATAEVQRLLREQADAKAECDRIDAEQAKAEEKRRNIGKALSEARVALDKANHDAAGVKFDAVAHSIVTTIGNIFTAR